MSSLSRWAARLQNSSRCDLAERALLEACRAGEVAQIGDQLPDESTDENRIRAAFLRFLVLGGDANAPIHEHGVQLMGAWIEGKFDLEGSHAPCRLDLSHCAFDAEPVLSAATIAGLSLSGSRVPGIQGDRLVCQSDVFLRSLSASGEVRLLGAQIGGNLECSGAKLDGKKGDALSADGAVIKGGVYLNAGFTASGAVRLVVRRSVAIWSAAVQSWMAGVALPVRRPCGDQGQRVLE